MQGKSNYTKRIQSYRISLDSIVLLEKIAKHEERNLIFAIESAISEKAQKLGIIATIEEIDSKNFEFEEKRKNKK